MISLPALQIIEYAVFGISGLGFLLCMCTLLFVSLCQRRSGITAVHKKFNQGWPTRLVLEATGALWLLFQWLRLSILWEPWSKIMPAAVTGWTGGGALCRLYLCLSLGLCEPLFLLTALVLCAESLQKGKADGRVPNGRLLLTAALGTLPMLALQSVVAWVSTAFPSQKWQARRGLLPIFFAPYLEGNARQCWGAERCVLCVFPAVACILSVALTALVGILLWVATDRMMRRAVNHVLHSRIHALQVSCIAGLALHQALQSATIAVPPFTWVFQLLWLGSFLALCWLVATASLLLAFLPVWDASCTSSVMNVDGGAPADVPLLAKADPSPSGTSAP